jgi:hypothetical protein
MSTLSSRVSSSTARSIVGNQFKARERVGGSFKFGVSGPQRNQDAIDVQPAIRFVQRCADRGGGAQKVCVMRQGALGWAGAWDGLGKSSRAARSAG